MGKLLRVLSVLFFLLAIAAFVLGFMLFNKRELLKGRTQKLENAVIQLANFIEDKPAEPEPASFPARDISDCSAQILPEPQKSDFWSSYDVALEGQDNPAVNLSPRKTELMSYYKIDPITLKIMRDPTGYPVTSGDGTMQGLLDELNEKAADQLNTLNKTRQQLESARQELVSVITELNSRKTNLRESLAEIVKLNTTIDDLQSTVRSLEGQVADLEQQKRDLEDQVAVQAQEIEQFKAEIADRDATIAQQRSRIEELIGQVGKAGGPIIGASSAYLRDVETGTKGSVVSVNPEWNFVIIELNDTFMAEIEAMKEILAKSDLAGSTPSVELLLKRGGPNGEFVAKVRLIQMKSDKKLGVADILADWQQLPILPGDVAIY